MTSFVPLVANTDQQGKACTQVTEQGEWESKASLGYGWGHVSKTEKKKRTKRKENSKARCDGGHLWFQLLGGEWFTGENGALPLTQSSHPSWAKGESGVGGKQTETKQYSFKRSTPILTVSLFYSVLFVFQTGSLYVAPAILELAMYTRLALN